MNKTITRAIVGFLTVIALAAITLAIPFAANAADTTAEGAGVRGLVTAASSTSITVHSKRANSDSTFTVSPTTVVKVDKADSTISAVVVGMHANILSADGKTADTIEAHTATPHTKAP